MGGFVYIWYDIKRKMFYVGSHWGSPDDKYVCSSVRMKRAFKRRPTSFKRRILATRADRQELLLEEERWLTMISDVELGTKYYNLHRRTQHWHGKSDAAEVTKKLKASWTEERRAKAKVKQAESWTPERKEKFSKLTTGRNRSEATKQLQRERWTEERKAKQAARLREITKKRFENYWDTHLTRVEKLSATRKAEGYKPPDRSAIARAMWSRKTKIELAEVVAKMSQASKGKTFIVAPDGKTKRIPLEELESWMQQGWIRGRTLTPSSESLRKRNF